MYSHLCLQVCRRLRAYLARSNSRARSRRRHEGSFHDKSNSFPAKVGEGGLGRMEGEISDEVSSEVVMSETDMCEDEIYDSHFLE